MELYELIGQLLTFLAGEAPLIAVSRLGKFAADGGHPDAVLLVPGRTF